MSILRCTKSVRGLTRLLKKPSEPAARLVATLSALTLTWKKPQQQRSRPALVVDLQFVISTQHGEVHPPKDSSRREMHVSDAIMTMWRRKILADIKLHAEMGSRLAAGYWRQVGNFEMARQVEAGGEARLKCGRKATSAPRRVRWTPAARFEVSAIMEMREEAAGKMLKVRWTAYHPSWEVFRQEGEGKRGDPVLTWEPEAEMLHTDAYKEWLERSAASTLPPSTARRVGRPRGVPTEVSLLSQHVDQLQREVAQLRRNNADTLSVATRGNATPIMPSPDLAQLKGKIETLEKDLRDTRNRLNSSLTLPCSNATSLRQNAKRRMTSLRTCAIACEISPTQIKFVTRP